MTASTFTHQLDLKRANQNSVLNGDGWFAHVRGGSKVFHLKGISPDWSSYVVFPVPDDRADDYRRKSIDKFVDENRNLDLD